MANLIDGTNGDDTLNGTAEIDVFIGTQGNDIINGGDAGYNQVDYEGSPADYVFTLNDDRTVTVQKPGGGVDTLSNIGGFWFRGSQEWLPLYDVLANVPDQGMEIDGTDGDDFLHGTKGNDTIKAGGGMDIINGSDGDDYIDGGDGGYNQVDYDGSPADYTFTQNSDGSVTVIKPNGGTDTLKNISGIWFKGSKEWKPIDQVLSNPEAAGRVINGTDDKDYLFGTVGDDTINAGLGMDVINGSGGNDYIDGGDDGYNQVDYDGRLEDYTFTLNNDGTLTVEKPDGGIDTLKNIQGFWFKGSGEWKHIDDILLHQPNTAPVAQNDAFAIDEDTQLTGNVLIDNGNGGDSDADGDTLTVTSQTITTANGGALVLNSDGSFTYDPAANFNGQDTFTYELLDGRGGTSTATATIDIAPVNDLPVAKDDQLTVTNDASGSVEVTLNDTDADGDDLEIVSIDTVGLVGTATIEADNDTITYNPNGQFDFLGKDQAFLEKLSYTISDGNGGTATAIVTIAVTGQNDGPLARDDQFAIDEDAPLAGNVLADNGNGADSDVDLGDSLTVTAQTITTANGGALVLNSDGSFTYNPAANYNGQDSFSYEVTDLHGATATATATIDIAPVNDAPVAQDDAFEVDEDTQLIGNVLADNGNGADSDVENDALTVTPQAITTAAGGNLILLADGSFTYDPEANFNGPDSFTYEVSDGNGGTATATATITIKPVNDAPVAQDDAFSIDEDTQLVGDVLADNGNGVDSDVDGDALTVTPQTITTANGGALKLQADGSFTYDPAADVNGVDSFTYELVDGNGGTATGTASITINPVNDAPIARDDVFAVAEDTQLLGNVLNDNGAGADSDVDGDLLTVTPQAVATAKGGTLTLLADGSFTYDPAADFNGEDSFTYEISDGSGGTATATAKIDVTPVQDGPVAQDDSFITDEDSQLIGNVLQDNGNGADSDVDGDPLTVTPQIIATTNGGALNLLADGSFTYDPAANFNGLDSFTYEISDGNGGTATATASITINSVNDAPVAKDDAFTTAEDSQLIGNVLVDNGSGEDSDLENDPLTVTPQTAATTANGGTLNLLADGSFTYDPAADFNGEDSFVYEISDGNGGTANGTATIDVSPVPEAPVVSGLSVDTGASDSDGITFDNTPTITGTADVGDTVEVFRDGTSIGSVIANGGFWSIGDASFLADGDYVYTAIATDGFGTLSAESAPLNVTVDTTAPAAPVVSAISDDTGISAIDGITSDASLTVSGTAEADSTVEVFRDGVSIGTVQAIGGQWSLPDSASLADGNYAYTAIATDVAGVASATSAPLNVEVDTAKPDAPLVNAIADDDATPGDGITSDTTLTISGTAEADSTVEVFRDGVSIGTTIAMGGTWSLADPATLDVDKYVYTATATDAAGNVSDLSGGFDVHVIGPLFSDGFDGVNFDNVVAGKYIDGTQYDSLGGQSEIRFATSQAEATEAGFDLLQAFNGGDDVDTYFSGFGQEIINGNGGNDRFVMIDGFAFDVIDGGTNNQSNVNDGDTLDLRQYTNGVTVNMTAGTYSDSIAGTSGTLTGIETVLGTEANDTITGSTLGDLLVGNGGEDVINGGGGNDLIIGDRFRSSEDDYSDDVLNGNGGNDSIYGDAGGDMTSGIGGNDTITGGGNNDSLVGDTAGDLSATGGNDTLIGNGGRDSIFGDTLRTLKGNGQGGDDLLRGGNQDDILVGDSRLMEGNTAAGGNDELIGNGGNDTLYGDVLYSLTDGVASSTDNGNGGDDDLDGGNGNDILIGQSGNDTLTGGAGADRFVFSSGFDEDTIVDFVKGTDTVDVTGFGLDLIGLQGVISSGLDDAGDLVLDFGNGDILTMNGQANQAIDTDDFDF